MIYVSPGSIMNIDELTDRLAAAANDIMACEAMRRIKHARTAVRRALQKMSVYPRMFCGEFYTL